jgi:transcriptional regulator with XRE-family HTH domain
MWARQTVTIGARIKQLRGHLGLNQAQMAEKFGTEYRTYQAYERDERKPNSSFLEALISCYFSVDWLLTGTGSMIRDNQAVNPPLVFSEELLQAVIIRVEQVFNDAGKVTSPEKKAQVIVTLYALLAEQAESGEPVKVPDPGTILRLVRLAG